MNNPFKIYNYIGSAQNIRFCVLFCCFLFIQNAYSQTINFKNENLETVFQQIEKKTDWTFNYDPELITDYSFTGKINLDKPDIFLKKILYDTPLEFETVRESLLIILPEKKEYLICGYVKGAEYKESLIGVNVYIENTNYGTTSDAKGYFKFKVKAHKNEQIIFNYLGYESQKQRIDTWKPDDCKKFFLKATTQTLGLDVTVKDQIIRSVSQGGNRTRLDYDRIREKNTYEEYDVLKTVQHLPGITSIDETATNLSIRGSTPDQNLILWEGVRLYDPGHFFGMISAVNPFVINKIDVYKDSYAPHFGNAIGGVVDMSLGNWEEKPLRAGVGSSFTEAHAHIAAPISKNGSFLMVSGRHSINELFDETLTIRRYTDKVFQYLLTDDETDEGEEGEIDEGSDFIFYDYNIKAVGQLNENTKIESAYFQSHNDFEINSLFPVENSEIMETTLFNSKALSTRLTTDFKGDLEWHSELYHTWSSYQNNYAFEYQENEDLESEMFTNGITDHQFGILNKLKISKKTRLHLGYNYENKAVNHTFSESSSFEGEDDDDEVFSQGNFHNIIGSVLYEKDVFRLEAHMRNTYYSELECLYLSPRITMQYKLRPSLKLRFSTGRFYQFISQVEDLENNGLSGSAIWVLHNEFTDDNGVLRSDKVAIGSTWTVNKWMLDAEAYWRNNLGILGSSVINSGDNFELTGTSQAMGLDVLLYRDWKYYGVWANYSLAKHTMYFSDIQEDRFSASNDHRHSLNLTGSINFNKWQGTLTWKYRSGLPFSSTPEVVPYTEIEEGEEETFHRLEYSRLNDQRQDPYSRVDAALSYKTAFHFKKRPENRLEKINFEARLALTNILNTQNFSPPNYYRTDSDDEEDETPLPFSIERQLLERTPQLLLRFYW